MADIPHEGESAFARHRHLLDEDLARAIRRRSLEEQFERSAVAPGGTSEDYLNALRSLSAELNRTPNPWDGLEAEHRSSIESLQARLDQALEEPRGLLVLEEAYRSRARAVATFGRRWVALRAEASEHYKEAVAAAERNGVRELQDQLAGLQAAEQSYLAAWVDEHLDAVGAYDALEETARTVREDAEAMQAQEARAR